MDVIKKLLSIGYSMEGDICIKTLNYNGDDFSISVLKHDFSSGAKYSIGMELLSADEPIFNQKPAKVNMFWLDPNCIVDSIEQMELKLSDALYTLIHSISKEQ